MKHKIISVLLWALVIVTIASIPIGIVCFIAILCMDIPKMELSAWLLIGEVIVFVIWYIGWRNK